MKLLPTIAIYISAAAALLLLWDRYGPKKAA